MGLGLEVWEPPAAAAWWAAIAPPQMLAGAELTGPRPDGPGGGV